MVPKGRPSKRKPRRMRKPVACRVFIRGAGQMDVEKRRYIAYWLERIGERLANHPDSMSRKLFTARYYGDGTVK